MKFEVGKFYPHPAALKKAQRIVNESGIKLTIKTFDGLWKSVSTFVEEYENKINTAIEALNKLNAASDTKFQHDIICDALEKLK